MHEVGDGVAKDPGRAAVLFTQGCTGGEPRACAKAKSYGR
jgi:TPR repeat protein